MGEGSGGCQETQQTELDYVKQAMQDMMTEMSDIKKELDDMKIKEMKLIQTQQTEITKVKQDMMTEMSDIKMRTTNLETSDALARDPPVSYHCAWQDWYSGVNH